MSNNTTVIDPNRRSLGRTFVEAAVWGAGFVMAAGALKLTWKALNNRKDDGDDAGEDDD